ncbi:MAG: DUF4139 domain-containing protein [Candidatus Mcinerneyibacterium aminivorans]|uniref:DUF4139 domain-containing protein n=1 Tax=Candidatus Mcinerneyibacterium aminivorans TaxID=2703815 RepID=A0A5D0MHK6_9BACT|nr:MAG: DUF4139 domain-containing protein [Candidatus Mcinerneyibacterium aminivorans]
MKKIFFLAILCILATLSFADGNLTVYNGNYGLYNEVFELDLKRGTHDDYSLRKVPTKIDTGSILIFPQNYKNQIEILEQNYDYDLVNMNKLIDKLLGSEVEFLTKGGKQYKGKLISTYGNNILLEKNDKYISIDTDEIREFLFQGSNNLIIEPTLSWKIKSNTSRDVDFKISYLMNDITWKAKYNLNLNENEKEGVLNSWIMLKNNSGKMFEDVNLQLMAGDVQKVSQAEGPQLRTKMMVDEARRDVSEEKISEYHLYTVERPISINNNQNKEIPLFSPVEIKVEKKLTYIISQNNKDVNVSMEFDNTKANNLGIAMPAGVVSVYKKDSNDRSQFLGEDSIDHTPRNEKISVNIGNAFDVIGETELQSRVKLSDGVYKYIYKVTLKNRKKEGTEVVAIFRRNSYMQLINSDVKTEDPESTNLRFNIYLKADEEKSFTFAIKTAY